MVGVVLWPAHQNWRTNPQDDFPLSYYPMFSAKRDETENFYYVVARDDHGNRFQVPHQWIGDGGGNQVRRQLRRIVNEGRAPQLARQVARRLAHRTDLPWSAITSVKVCSGRFAVDEYFHGHKDPATEQVHGSAEVERNKR
jgi:hypothetical protein